MSLKENTIYGVLWSSFEKFGTLSIQFIYMIVMARLLSPSDFGIVGMLTIFISVGQVILDSGFGQALIRLQKYDDLHFSSIFIINVIMGVLLYGILFYMAPYISLFYREPSLTLISRISFLIFPINSLSIVQYTLLVKKMDFKSISKISLFSIILSTISGITYGYFYPNIFALLIQNVSFYFYRLLLLWYYGNWKLSCRISWSKLQDLMPFSFTLLATGFISTVVGELYSLSIGKFFSSSVLGLYSQAERFSKIPSFSITDVVQRVTYPALSVLQDDDQKLKHSYRMVIMCTFFIVLPVMLFLFISAGEIFELLFTEKWVQAGTYFKYLCFVAIMYPVNSINLNILKVKGRNKLILSLEIIRKLIMVIILVLSIGFGMEGVLIGQIVFSFIQLFFNCYFSGRQISYNLRSQFLDISPILFLGAGAILVTWYISSIYNSPYVFINIFLKFICFFCTYLFLAKFLNLSVLTIFKGVLFSFFKRR